MKFVLCFALGFLSRYISEAIEDRDTSTVVAFLGGLAAGVVSMLDI